MAQPNLESFDRRGVAIKLETTEGTDATPDPAVDGIMLMNGTSGTEFDKVERPIDRPFFTNNPFAVANRRAFIEGDIEVFPPSAPGDAANGIPHQDVLYRIAGMARVLDDVAGTTTYNPLSAGFASASAYWWHVDQHLKILGARANLTNLRMEIGEIPMGRVRLQGVYDQVQKEALPSIVLPEFVPRALEADNSETHIESVDGTTLPELLLWGKGLSIDFGNALATKEYTSKKINTISDRLATWNLRIARADLADFNPWALRDAGVLIMANIYQEYAAIELGVRLGIRGQIEQCEVVDIDGDAGWQLSGPCIASSVGGDELFLQFEDLS